MAGQEQHLKGFFKKKQEQKQNEKGLPSQTNLIRILR